MKKNIALILIIALFLSSIIAFADIELNFKGHWAESIVDKQIIQDHFKYLLKEGMKVSDLNNAIDKKYFLLSLYTILNEHQKESIDKTSEKTNIENAARYLKNKQILEKNGSIEGKLTRKEAAKYIIKTLELSREIQLADTGFMPFKDILGLNDEYKKYVAKASMIGIIKGYGDSTFRPEEDVTAIESIIFLQRLKGEIEEMNKNIPFKIVEEKWSGTGTNNQVTAKQSGGKAIVTVTKEFPTSGYNLTVKRVEKYAYGKYKIHVDVKAPAPNSILLQVITYKSITIEIDRKLLDSGNYTFEMTGGSTDVKTK
ncbi:S-layer homology domain-containing protein [Proteiniborus sp. MB09-C3]|uniref:S-layer homology domain-containing protein n=1 Tax=Proteiniborus sp. MB09-C3 TaxID=3050072 RepID=UPI00255295D9|nr:S-layer homology domain-containing protein [Proteiniborus sp. MB09-C3]WIV12247.1 S-layer homology domain-containing protein [Proteiniborus sp. MB09-C3]